MFPTEIARRLILLARHPLYEMLEFLSDQVLDAQLRNTSHLRDAGDVKAWLIELAEDVRRSRNVDMRRYLIAQTDDPELLEWMAKARDRGSHFISSMATAGLIADHENYPLIRPALMELRLKYREYEPSDAVKKEIRERVK